MTSETYTCLTCGGRYTDYRRAVTHLVDAHPTLVGEPPLHLTITTKVEADG